MVFLRSVLRESSGDDCFLATGTANMDLVCGSAVGKDPLLVNLGNWKAHASSDALSGCRNAKTLGEFYGR